MVTIYDIARECGCSSATVSKVFNNSGNISEKKRKEILQAADRLGYIPNITARNLVNSKSNMVGVLLFIERTLGLRNELFAEMLNAFRSTAEEYRYEILLISEEASLWKGSLLGHCKALRLDGVFSLCGDYVTPALLELAGGDIPLVGFEIPYENSYCVESDNYEGAKKMTRYLLSKGHTQIAFVSGWDTFVTRERIRGYRDALAESGQQENEIVLHGVYFSKDEGKDAVQLLLNCPKKFTAAILPEDYTAITVIRELKKNGICVPEDLSVAGFDGVSFGRYITPQLTTVTQNARALGKAAAEMLIGRIEGREQTPRVVRLDMEIFEGESIRPVGTQQEK